MGKRAVFVMAMVWSAGCVVVDDGNGDGYVPPADVGDDACAEGCEALDACGLCMPDGNGGCLDAYACAADCRAGGDQALGECLAMAGCDDLSVEACYDATDIGDDACAQGCLALDACGQGLSDGAGGTLTPRECAEACREAGDEQAYGCVAAVEGCDQDAIDACYDDVVIGDDACARGCLALDACDLCEPGEGDACLTPLECAEACRADEAEAKFGCLAEVEACDTGAIDACYDPPADACAEGCAALDACDLCLPGDDDECLSVEACAEACRAGGTPARAACVAEVEGCDMAAIEACFAEEPAPSCEVVCQRVVECAGPADAEAALAACAADCEEFEDETRTCVAEAQACGDVGTCVGRDFACEAVCAVLEACDLGQPGGCTCAGFSAETRACLDAAADCDARAACLDPAPPAPTCEAACARRVDCDMSPAEAREAALAECVAACDADDAERLRCVIEAEECGAIAACDAPAECAAICAARAGCGDAAEGCAEACVRDVKPDLRACLLGAADCDAAAACEKRARCDLVCARTAGCGAEVAPDCAEACVADLSAEQIACALEAECDALPACVAPPEDVRAACEAACARLDACGGPAECLDGCVRDSTPEQRRCVADAADCPAALGCL